jgi:hypothetical protein
MPQIVVRPFIARTMVEGVLSVKVRLRSATGSRLRLSPRRHADSKSASRPVETPVFPNRVTNSPNQVTKTHRLTAT